jgi:hypothetical protein
MRFTWHFLQILPYWALKLVSKPQNILLQGYPEFYQWTTNQSFDELPICNKCDSYFYIFSFKLGLVILTQCFHNFFLSIPTTRIQVLWFYNAWITLLIMCFKSIASASSVVYIIIYCLIMYYPKLITHPSSVTESKNRIQ